MAQNESLIKIRFCIRNAANPSIDSSGSCRAIWETSAVCLTALANLLIVRWRHSVKEHILN